MSEDLKEVRRLYTIVFNEDFNNDKLFQLAVNYADKVKDKNQEEMYKIFVEILNKKKIEKEQIELSSIYYKKVEEFDKKYGYVNLGELQAYVRNYLHDNKILFRFQTGKLIKITKKLEAIFLKFFSKKKWSSSKCWERSCECIYKYLFMKYIDNSSTSDLQINIIDL